MSNDNETKYSKAYERLTHLVAELGLKNLDSEAHTLACMLDEINNLYYEHHFEVSDLNDDLDSYEDIMENTFTIVKVRDRNAKGLHSWCLENLKSDWHHLRGDRIAFVDSNEATLFKLAWGGKS